MIERFRATHPRTTISMTIQTSSKIEEWAAAQHIDDFQDVVRVAVKDTPAGLSLDLERSRDA